MCAPVPAGPLCRILVRRGGSSGGAEQTGLSHGSKNLSKTEEKEIHSQAVTHRVAEKPAAPELSTSINGFADLKVDSLHTRSSSGWRAVAVALRY